MDKRQEALAGVSARVLECISKLISPMAVFVASEDGSGCWHEQLSLLRQVELCQDSRAGFRGRRVARGSVPPTRLAVLGWLCEVDAVLAGWVDEFGLCPSAEHDVRSGVLCALALRGWVPEDVPRLEEIEVQLRRWYVEAVELTCPAIRVELRGTSCPVCGGVSVVEWVEGERVRHPVLVVDESGCRCRGCGAVWSPDRFLLLGAVLRDREGE